MLICPTCRIEMTVAEQGLGADYGNGHVYLGSIYACPACGMKVLSTNTNAIRDVAHQYARSYIRMATPEEVMG